MNIPPYPPDHFSILTPEMQRDWWRDRCREAMILVDRELAGDRIDYADADALRKAIEEAK